MNVTSMACKRLDLNTCVQGQGAHRTTPQSAGPLSAADSPRGAIYTAVNPDGIDNITCYEVSALHFRRGNGTLSNSEGACYQVSSHPATASQCWAVEPSSKAISVVKLVGIASSDAFPQQEQATALKAVTLAQQDGYDQLLKEHQHAWAETWEESDIIIPGEDKQELQYAARASLFHILTNLRKGSEPHGLGDTSIAPAGLTSDSYAGQIFWDADTWMIYPLLSLFPEYAEVRLPFYTSSTLGPSDPLAEHQQLPLEVSPCSSNQCSAVQPFGGSLSMDRGPFWQLHWSWPVSDFLLCRPFQ